MKITGYDQITSKYLKNDRSPVTNKNNIKSNQLTPAVSRGEGIDKVEISSYAVDVRNVAEENKKFDLRLEQLKQAIETGQYSVDTEKIAKLMLKT